MKYTIMCGGKYKHLDKPKQLSVVNGETLIERTVRLLNENGVKEIYISSMNPIFDRYGIRIEHKNEYETDKDKKIKGYWVDAFYPTEESMCYIFGDVYFSPEAIKTIVETETDDILFFASKKINRKEYFKKWEEPFAFKVANQKRFREGIEYCKKEVDLDRTDREPISWELYRVLNGYNINNHIIGKNFIAIDDYTTDIDCTEDIYRLEEILKNIDKE